jgi:hypothetical protein
MKKKTVLLLTNAYSNDLQLIDYAIALAKSQQSFLELFDAQWIARGLTIELAPSITVEEMKTSTKAFHHSEQQMENLCTMVQKKYPLTDYKLTKSLMNAQFPNKVDFWMNEIKAIQPKAVVMRTQNELNLWNEMFGTAESEIAEQANCPVLLIPKKLGTFMPLKKIGYFLDREKPMDEAIQEINFLSKIAAQYDGEVNTYYLSDTEEEDAAKIELALIRSQFQQAIDLEKFHVQDFSSSYTPKLVNDLVKIKVNNLIAFPKREKTFFQRWNDQDNTKRLILDANIPVLVF